MSFDPILSRRFGTPGSHTIDFYEREDRGYQAARKALGMTAAQVIDEVKKSELRGRGGAGFPCGQKWGFVPAPKDVPGPRYLVVNADESEPGTFKDRALLWYTPHAMLEGAIIAAHAIGAESCYVYIRGEFAREAVRVGEAVREAYAKGYFGRNVFGTGRRIEMTVHRGAGAYICGEETGLLSSLEGGRGYPKIKPPFPAVKGLFGQPTIVNNVETLACVPLILDRGAEWFKSIGTPGGTGPKLYCVSGHVERPGLFEFPCGVNLRALLGAAGGVWKGRRLKAVIPGGSSAKILRADETDVAMDFASLQKAGTMLGSAGVIVLDETTCMVNALWNVLRFFHHESCGQCTPCREGTGWIEKLVGRIERGGGKQGDLDTLLDVAANMQGTTVCVLSDAAAWPAESYTLKFRDEFEEHIRRKGCPFKKESAMAGALA
ncbi:MAG: NADH-quinone oxidoreductase subunit NuoF [Planctomycetes bacterium]|nr:NADH-quinone oxidoreductase subunit NuoF [Planctomycetota bacterium]